MAERMGHWSRETDFLTKWSSIRGKGKARFILTRGSLLGLLLFAVWLVVTIIEINVSDFEKAAFSWDVFIRRSVTWFICEMVIGLVLAISIWRGKEEKFRYLS